jgi:hypothetical protein
MADIFDMADTWNNGATTFAAIKMNVTNTASAADSLLMDLQVGGVSALRLVASDGRLAFGGAVLANAHQIYATGTNTSTSILAFGKRGTWATFLAGNESSISGAVVRSDAIIGFASTATPGDGAISGSDVRLYRDAADTLAQRRGTTAQAFRLYNTFTDASNYERGVMQYSSNLLEIGHQGAGTGATARSVAFGVGAIAAGVSFHWKAGLDGATTFTLMTLTAETGPKLSLRESGKFGWTAGSTSNDALTTALSRPSAGVVRFEGASSSAGSAIELIEMTAPAVPAVNMVRIYAEDNGSGKTRLMARFATGAAVQIAIEP